MRQSGRPAIQHADTARERTTSRRFERTFRDFIRPGMHVLDLGCGPRAYHARRLVELGCSVEAVDQHPIEKPIEGIAFTQSSIEQWVFTLTDEHWNAVLMVGILHFLDPVFALSTLLPRLKGRVEPGGMIAISTFYDYPDPPLPVPLRSTYDRHQLERALMGWDIAEARQTSLDGHAMDGSPHTFYKSMLIARNPCPS